MTARTTSAAELLRSRICRLVLQLRHLEQKRYRLALQLKHLEQTRCLLAAASPCGSNWPSLIKIISRRSRRSRNDRSQPTSSQMAQSRKVSAGRSPLPRLAYGPDGRARYRAKAEGDANTRPIYLL